MDVVNLRFFLNFGSLRPSCCYNLSSIDSPSLYFLNPMSRCAIGTLFIISKAVTLKFSSKKYFNGTKPELSSYISVSHGSLKLVLSDSWKLLVIECITFQYAVVGNAPSLSIFLIFWRLTWRCPILCIIWSLCF